MSSKRLTIIISTSDDDIDCKLIFGLLLSITISGMYYYWFNSSYVVASRWFITSSFSVTISNLLQLIKVVFALLLFLRCLQRRYIVGNNGILYLGILLYSIIIVLLHTKNPIRYMMNITSWTDIISPGTVFGLAIFFFGMRDSVWVKMRSYFRVLYIIYALLLFYSVFSIRNITHRLEWYAYSREAASFIMMVPMLSFSLFKNKIMKYSGLVVTIIMAIMLQSRMSLIAITMYAIIYFWGNNSSTLGEKKYSKAIFYAILLCMVAYFLFFSKSDVISSFYSRLDSDTRSSQYVDFLPYLKSNWLFGVGNDRGSVFGTNLRIDNGYLETIMTGGIPLLLLCLCFLHFNIIKCGVKRLNQYDLALVTAGICRIILHLSSSKMTFSIDFFIFAFVAGRCHYLNIIGKEKDIPNDEEIFS